MFTADNFLTSEEEDAIVHAIQKAEKKTSGEIRVHLAESESDDSLKDAQAVFLKLGMDKTALRNGVLIHINVSSRELAIIGDRGINDMVPKDYWDTIVLQMVDNFGQGKYKDGIVEGVLEVGESLKKYFPYDSNDIDELPNTISKE